MRYLTELALSLVNFSVKNLVWFMIGCFFLLQALSHEIKIFFFGHPFLHYLDLALLVALTLVYFYLSRAMAMAIRFEDEHLFDGLEPDYSPSLPEIESKIARAYIKSRAANNDVVESVVRLAGSILLVAGKTDAATINHGGFKITIQVEDDCFYDEDN